MLHPNLETSKFPHHHLPSRPKPYWRHEQQHKYNIKRNSIQSNPRKLSILSRPDVPLYLLNFVTSLCPNIELTKNCNVCKLRARRFQLSVLICNSINNFQTKPQGYNISNGIHCHTLTPKFKQFKLTVYLVFPYRIQIFNQLTGNLTSAYLTYTNLTNLI